MIFWAAHVDLPWYMALVATLLATQSFQLCLGHPFVHHLQFNHIVCGFHASLGVSDNIKRALVGGWPLRLGLASSTTTAALVCRLGALADISYIHNREQISVETNIVLAAFLPHIQTVLTAEQGFCLCSHPSYCCEETIPHATAHRSSERLIADRRCEFVLDLGCYDPTLRM